MKLPRYPKPKSRLGWFALTLMTVSAISLVVFIVTTELGKATASSISMWTFWSSFAVVVVLAMREGSKKKEDE